MTNGRLLLAALLCAGPAAAAVVEIPASAASAPLAPAVVSGPAATGPSLLSGRVLLAGSLSAAPAPAAFVSPARAAAASASAASAAPAAAVPAFLAPPVSAAGASEARAPRAAEPAAAPSFVPAFAPAWTEGPRPAAIAPSAPRAQDLDALFDGRVSAAAAEPVPSGRPSRAPSRALVRRSRLIRRALGVGLPLAAAAAGVIAPHAALLGAHALGQAAYWLANPLAFLFTMPQIHRMLARRSAEISPSMTVVGFLAALATTLCFGYDGKDLMMYRNLAQAAGFAVLFVLQGRFTRVRQAPPSRARAAIETGAVALGVLALMLAGGPSLMAASQALPVLGVLLAPLQILAGFGFTYMMYAQLKKMRAEQSSGDSSSGMMWAFLGTKTIWVWSFATMLALSAAPAWRTLAVGGAFAAASWLLSRAALSRLLRSRWRFLPERVAVRGWSVSRAALGDAAAFAALAGLILGLSAAGWAAFTFGLGVPAASASAFAMYAIYTVQNLVSCVATLETIRLQQRLDRAARLKARA